MNNILNQLNVIHENALNEVIELLQQQNEQSTLTNDEWNEVLLQASNITGVSVEALLEKINAKTEYEQWLCNEAEEEYQQMMGAEDSVYGCDPYPEY